MSSREETRTYVTRRRDEGLNNRTSLPTTQVWPTPVLSTNRRPLDNKLEDGELPGLMGDLELVRYEEGWQDDRHDARFVARNATG
jgi:hypothetical protein